MSKSNLVQKFDHLLLTLEYDKSFMPVKEINFMNDTFETAQARMKRHKRLFFVIQIFKYTFIRMKE